MLFYSCAHRVNKDGYTPVNAACLNSHAKCLELLVMYGGSLECVSAAQRESAIVSAHKTGRKKIVKLVNRLKDEACNNDNRDLLTSAANDYPQVCSFNNYE